MVLRLLRFWRLGGRQRDDKLPFREGIYELKFAQRGTTGQILRLDTFHAVGDTRSRDHGIPE